MLFKQYSEQYARQFPGKMFEELPAVNQQMLLVEWIDDHRTDFCTYLLSTHVAQLFCQLLTSLDPEKTAQQCGQDILAEAMKKNAHGALEGYAWAVALAYEGVLKELAEKAAKQENVFKKAA